MKYAVRLVSCVGLFLAGWMLAELAKLSPHAGVLAALLAGYFTGRSEARAVYMRHNEEKQ